MPDPVPPPPSSRRAAKLWAWVSIFAGIILVCAALASSGFLLLLQVMLGYDWIAILLALPAIDLGVLGAVVLADGCILLTGGQRSPRPFDWMVMPGYGLLVTCIIAMAVLAPVLH